MTGRSGRSAGGARRGRPAVSFWTVLCCVPFVYIAGVYLVTALLQPPELVGHRGAAHRADAVEWLVDDSWIDSADERQLEQSIFDAMLSMIDEAESLIVLDLFLFNDWQGPVKETHRALSAELTEALIARRQSASPPSIVLISDPINTVYGGLPSRHFKALRAAGIDVVLTDLTGLQDSNPLYSSLWRWLVRPFGNERADTLANPFGPGRVSLRSYLALVNFKANHRKLVIADDASGELQALITSANPHDGSSAHRNTALRFDGAAAAELLHNEYRLLQLSGAGDAARHWPARWRTLAERGPASTGAASAPEKEQNRTNDSPESTATLRILNESAIKTSVLRMLARARSGDRVDLSMFYLSERDVIGALIDAHTRRARVRVLLDVNSDAFGRQKNGVPNKPVAAELFHAGVPVRWCATDGEQCHAKQLQLRLGGKHHLLLGSGNFTRRNLDDFNLETDVVLQAAADHPALQAASRHFDRAWNNTLQRRYSTDYETHADENPWLLLQYRFMEATGISTF